jgi:hypothetical protein
MHKDEHNVAHVRAWVAYQKQLKRNLQQPMVDAINRAARGLDLGNYIPKERFEIASPASIKRDTKAQRTIGAPADKVDGHLPDEEHEPVHISWTEADPQTRVASVQYSRPGNGFSFHWLRANGETTIARDKLVGMVIERVDGKLTVRYNSLPTPVTLADGVLEAANKKEKLWEKQELLAKAIHNAHNHIARLDTRTTAGLAKANRWADAIEMMAGELAASDFVLNAVSRAETVSFRPRRKPDGKIAFYPPEEVNGRRIWTPIIDVDARYAPRWQGATGSRWETIQGQFVEYKRLVTFPIVVAAGRTQLGDAELGLDDEFTPPQEPAEGQRQAVILRSSGENTMEIPDEMDSPLNVVDEEKIDRRYTYNPDAEEERAADLLNQLYDCSTADDFVLLHDEIEIAWKARAFRWHVYREVMNAVIKMAQELFPHPPAANAHLILEALESKYGKKSSKWKEARKTIVQRDAINSWVLVGSSDAEAPSHMKDLRQKIAKLKRQRVTEIRPAIDKLLSIEKEQGLNGQQKTQLAKLHKALKENLSQARPMLTAVNRFDRKNGRAMQWSWENHLSRVGLSAGFNGQPFSDTSEDALGRKDARGGDMETMENMADDGESRLAELLEISGVGEATILALEDAGYVTAEQVNEASFEELNAAIGNKRRALIVWLCGANIVTEKVTDRVELRHVAESLFGRTRGTAVDLLRPWHRPEKNINALIRRGDISDSPYLTREEAEEALKIQRWMRPEAWDHLPRSEFTGHREFVPDEDFVSRCLFVGEEN